MFLYVFWIPAWVKKRRKQPDNRFKKTLKITLKCMPFGTKFQSFRGSVFECEILTSWGRSWPRFRPPFWGILAAQTLVKRSYKGYARHRRNNPRKKQKIGPTWRRQPPVNTASPTAPRPPPSRPPSLLHPGCWKHLSARWAKAHSVLSGIPDG